MKKDPLENGLIVLGMHRSGTSCLAGMLESAGFTLGKVDEWNPDNLRGNRENQQILRLNEAVFRTSDGAWDRPPKRLLTTPEQCQHRDKLLGTLAGLGGPWLFKDPRTLFTLPFWLEGSSKFRMIGVVRNPISVAESLSLRDGLRLVDGLRLWFTYNSELLSAVQRLEFPVLYFVGKKGGFVNAAKVALAKDFDSDVKRGTLNPGRMDEFFTEDLIHHTLRVPSNLRGQVINIGLEKTEADRLLSLWTDLLSHVHNPPVFDIDSPELSIEPDRVLVVQREVEALIQTKTTSFDSSLHELNEMISHSSHQIGLWRKGIELYAKFGCDEQLAQWLGSWVDKRQDDPFLLFELAKLNWVAGNSDQAIQGARKSTCLAPGWLPPLKYLANWLAKTKQWEDAANALVQLSEYEGANSGIVDRKRYYAELYYDLGDGFNARHSIRNEYLLAGKAIDVSFDISEIEGIVGLRLDLINEIAVVDILEIVIVDENNCQHAIIPSSSSARHVTGSRFYFDNDDPQICFESYILPSVKLVQLRAGMKVVSTNVKALQACIETLSRGSDSLLEESVIPSLSTGSDLVDSKFSEKVPSIVDIHVNEIGSSKQMPNSRVLSGWIDVVGNSLPKLALRYRGATRIYTLTDNGFDQRDFAQEIEATPTVVRRQFCHSVPAACIIEFGVEYDMRLFWLKSIES